jgi:alpha-tubulin suppressor-like RCC1 family protein
VWCWGTNSSYGEGGHSQGSTNGDVFSGVYWCYGTPKEILTASSSAPFDNVVKVRTHRNGACALRTDNTVWCWGSNAVGELRNGTVESSAAHLYPFESIDAGSSDIAGGDQSLFSIQSAGVVVAWGSDPGGVLGLGTFTYDMTGGGQQAGPLAGVKSISAVFDHGIATEPNGTLLTWGNNTNGVLGHAPGATGSGDVACPSMADAGVICNPTPKPMTNLPWN